MFSSIAEHAFSHNQTQRSHEDHHGRRGRVTGPVVGLVEPTHFLDVLVLGTNQVDNAQNAAPRPTPIPASPTFIVNPPEPTTHR